MAIPHRHFESLARQKWTHLKATTININWEPILEVPSLDFDNKKILVALARECPAGQREANRFIWQRKKPAPLDQHRYHNACAVYEENITRALPLVFNDPENHKNYKAWTVGRNLTPYFGRQECLPS